MSGNELLLDGQIKPNYDLAQNENDTNRYQGEPIHKKTGRLCNRNVGQLKRNKLILQKAVYEWIRRIMYYTDFNLNDTLIHTMSFEFSKVLKMAQFYPDLDWIKKFRATYNLADANTKTMSIGYQESHSVRMQDILCYVKDVVDGDDKINLGSIATDTGEILAAVFEVEEIKTTNDKNDFCGNVDTEVEEENVQPSCSIDKMLQAPDVPQGSTGINISSEEPMQIDSESTSYQPVQIKPQTTNYDHEEIQPVKKEMEPESVPEPIAIHSEEPEPEPEQIAIYSRGAAISCIRLLEDFALLKENFRLIGLIERLEEALNEKTDK